MLRLVFFSSRRRHTRLQGDWSSDVCSSDLLNTCLVRYTITNKDGNKRTHKVGLRVLMDTCIGDKDDVPFTLPGVKEVVTKAQNFEGPDVPDFVQVLEKPSLRDPGIILQLSLRLDKD